MSCRKRVSLENRVYTHNPHNGPTARRGAQSCSNPSAPDHYAPSQDYYYANSRRGQNRSLPKDPQTKLVGLSGNPAVTTCRWAKRFFDGPATGF